MTGLKRFTTSTGSYMSAHVLLNLLNKLSKRDKMRGLPSILLLFRNELNKFDNTGARMSNCFYHMILKSIKIVFFAVKMSIFCHLLRNVTMDVIMLSYEICKPLVVY